MELAKINISPEKEKQFNRKGIYTTEDLLRFLPKNYYDFRVQSSIPEAQEGEMISLYAIVLSVEVRPKCIWTVMRDINSLEKFKCIWFGSNYLADKLEDLYFKNVIVCGVIKYNEQYKTYEIVNPIIFSEEVEKYQRLYPNYPKIEGMSMEYLQNSIEKAIMMADKNEKYDDETLQTFDIVKEYEMYQMIHKPKDEIDRKKAKRRLVFEELYDFAYVLEKDNKQIVNVSPYIIRTLDKTNALLQSLPYKLTQDQQESINAMIEQMKCGKRVNSLLQGDVGTGKTIVAIILMMAMAENGYQSVLMAPTSVLAEQHYKEICEYADKLGFEVAYVGATMKAAEKRKLLKGIKEGQYSFIIGTHAVISKDVEFNKLGFVVIDEEHRFGVNQREKLTASPEVHSLTMSATPIPRTLAMASYGKAVDVHTIKTKPDGRKEIRTGIYNNDANIFKFVSEQIKEGRQCYFVCPLKTESDSLEVESVEALYEKLSNYFEGTDVKIGVMTGGMKKEEMQATLSQFAANEIQILIATTIVEVGVNVPNASCIVIRDADRFGLATLHQLRGRVGRGQYQSYCILKSPNKQNPRLLAMCETTDGFEIAKKDLEIRGSGDFLGTKQSGENKSVMLMLHYPKFYKKIEEYVEKKLQEDVKLHF